MFSLDSLLWVPALAAFLCFPICATVEHVVKAFLPTSNLKDKLEDLTRTLEITLKGDTSEWHVLSLGRSVVISLASCSDNGIDKLSSIAEGSC